MTREPLDGIDLTNHTVALSPTRVGLGARIAVCPTSGEGVLKSSGTRYPAEDAQYSALSFWDLTDEIPAEVHLAVPRGAHRPRISYPPTRVHVFATGTFELGGERVRLKSGEEISIYSPERSVVDAMRLRGRIGNDVAYEALRRYLRRPGSSPGDLVCLARRLRVGGPMADALEVLTG